MSSTLDREGSSVGLETSGDPVVVVVFPTAWNKQYDAEDGEERSVLLQMLQRRIGRLEEQQGLLEIRGTVICEQTYWDCKNLKLRDKNLQQARLV